MGDVVAPEPPATDAPSLAKVVKTLGDKVEVQSLLGGGGGGGGSGGGGGVEIVKKWHVPDGGHVGAAASSAGLPLKVHII